MTQLRTFGKIIMKLSILHLWLLIDVFPEDEIGIIDDHFREEV